MLKHGWGKLFSSQTEEVLNNLYKYLENESNSNSSSIKNSTPLVVKSTGSP